MGENETMRRRFIEQGLSLTFLCWMVAGLLSLGAVIGDCLPDAGRPCPTDHQRDMHLLKIVLGAAALNIGGLLLLGYRQTGTRQD